EVVAGRGECQGRRLLVAQPQRLADDHPEREDDDEVHEQGQGDAGDIARMRGDLVALEGEEQDDGEEQSVQCPRPDLGEEPVFVPLASFRLLPHSAGEEAGDRKSTRLNSSHVSISYAVFCLKKKTKTLYNTQITNVKTRLCSED